MRSVFVIFALAAAFLAMASRTTRVSIREGYGDKEHACGCDPWSEACVEPPHGAPSYGCIRPFDSHMDDDESAPIPRDGHWLEWGFGHGHPLTPGHTEEESTKIAAAVFGPDSPNTRLIKNEAMRREVDHPGVHDLFFHKYKPKFQTQCGIEKTMPEKAERLTEKAVFADPVTTYTNHPIHLPTKATLHPKQSLQDGRCRPSVTGIFQVCGPMAVSN